MLLVEELRAACLTVSATLEILGRGPIIPLFEQKYMLVPPGLSGGWGSFVQALRPS